jgi:hypothetical protein
VKLVQQTGALEPQFREIINNALDRRAFAEVTSHGTPDTEYSVTHGLGVIPVGFLVISQDKAGVSYKSTTAWDTEKIYLKTSVATVALRILIF